MIEIFQHPHLQTSDPMQRRQFLARTGLALGMAAVAANVPFARSFARTAWPQNIDTWNEVREQFNLAPDLIHMSTFFLASHPRPVREAIERHRQGLDANPFEYWWENEVPREKEVLEAASKYLGVSPTDIALTDSTTMGLGLLYGSLTLRPGQEILTTTHDHYSTDRSLQLRAQRTGATVKRISLYRNPATTSTEEIVDAMVKAVRPKTRVVAVTWVHSCTGVKLPIRQMADALAKINRKRKEQDRVLLCVDGVHGLGVENVTMSDLECDFFVAGTHKWLFGPRGTGLVWGKTDAWPAANAIIPAFDSATYEIWMKLRPPENIPFGATMTPGGFHSFEHRWALSEAFRFHEGLGKHRIAERIHSLNRQLKEGLAGMKHVTLHTPMSEDLSAGIVCFEIAGLAPDKVVERLRERKIVASVTPYATLYARLAPSLLTSPEDVETTIREVHSLNKA